MVTMGFSHKVGHGKLEEMKRLQSFNAVDFGNK